MDIIDNIINDWQASITSDNGSETLLNTKNESIMNTFIAFELKEKQRKENLKKLSIFLGMFFSIILLIYALMNFFKATTISYDLAAMVIGIMLMLFSIGFTYFNLDTKKYQNEANLPMKQFISELKNGLVIRKRKLIQSYLILIIVYSLGAAMVCYGIFHSWFGFFLIGFILFIITVVLFSWQKENKEQQDLHNELDVLISEFNV